MQIKSYFQLFRLPNIFTVPGDIIAGHFIIMSGYANNAIQNSGTGESGFGLLTLVFSSIFLYVAGMVSNDLFDFGIDKIQRSSRPLAQGAISKKTATIICVIFFSLGLFLSTLVSITSFFISIILSIGIISYNYKIKNGFFRPFLMGGLRFLNVIYGATLGLNFLETLLIDSEKIFSLVFLEIGINPLGLLILCSTSVFIHIFTLTWISSKETYIEYSKQATGQEKRIQHIYVIYLMSLAILGFLSIPFIPYITLFVIFYSVFFITTLFIFYQNFFNTNKIIRAEYLIQKIVKNQIVMLILLDSAFIAGTSGIMIGIISASLVIPCIILSKKIKMT